MYANSYESYPYVWPPEPPEELSLVNGPSPPTNEDYERPQYTTADFTPGGYYTPNPTGYAVSYDLTQTQVPTLNLLSQEQAQQGPVPYHPQFPYQNLPDNNILNEPTTIALTLHTSHAGSTSSLTNLGPLKEILAEALGQSPMDPTGGPMNPYYTCDDCGLRSKRKHNIKAHIREVHLNKRPYNCPNCPKSYKRNSQLKKHMNKSHKQK